MDLGCRACPFGKDGAGPVGGAGPDDLKAVRLLVVSDYPGHYEVQAKHPFASKPAVYRVNAKQKVQLRWMNAGEALRTALRILGLNGYTDCWLTNALKCSPAADSGKVKENELDVCTKLWFYDEVMTLHEVNPQLPIWLAGGQALAGFRRTFKLFQQTSINDLRRQVHWWMGHPVVVTWNPAAYCRSEFREAKSHQHPVEVFPLFSEPLPLSPWEMYLRDIQPLASFLNPAVMETNTNE